MKKALFISMAILCLCTLSQAQNLSGALNGALGPGTYNVVDSIYVQVNDSLTIAPGTDFLFSGAFGFGVAGYLNASGTETDSINFRPNAGVPFWKGIGFIDSASDSSILEYCSIISSNDMGIWIDYANITIRHCTFTDNSSSYMGGGLYCTHSNIALSHCVFANNNAVHGGGCAIRWSTPVAVDNCVFYGNSGTYGGAVAFYFSDNFTVENCLFYTNTANAGGGIRFSSSTPELINCTFAQNIAADGGGIFIINQSPTMRNSLFWGNDSLQIFVHAGGVTVNYCNVQDVVWPGTGNISADPLFTTGPMGNYYLSQIAAGQASNSPCLDAGDPASPVITGTTRTDCVQDSGIVDIGYHYPLTAGQPDLVVTLTPHNPPIRIPGGGGGFIFDAQVENVSQNPITFDAWTNVEIPGGAVVGPLVLRTNLIIPGGATILRTLSQYVPPNAPAGNYVYHGYVGTHPGTVIAEDRFGFEKSGNDGSVNHNLGWAVFGWDDDGAVAPQEYRIFTAYPNPFNPQTNLMFSLDRAGEISLVVYDVNGRAVAELLEGWMSGGSHNCTFDASLLPSGVYFARLQGEGFSLTQKLLLVK